MRSNATHNRTRAVRPPGKSLRTSHNPPPSARTSDADRSRKVHVLNLFADHVSIFRLKALQPLANGLASIMERQKCAAGV